MAWHTTFLKELAVGLVVDFTPGFGALSQVCLEFGIIFVGVCRSVQHSSWLANVLNRASVEIATRVGAALYGQDLATCLNDHVKELIDELVAKDAAESDVEDE